MSTTTTEPTNTMQVIACVVFFFFIFYFMQRKKYIIAVICAIAFANYVAMNLNVGVITDSTGYQQDYIPRYVDWSLTTPLLVLTLLLKCKVKDPSVYVLVLAMDVLMVYTGFLAATVTNNEKKRNVLFATSCFFYLVLFYLLYTRCYACHPGLFLFLFVAWLVYPVVWILHRVPASPRTPLLTNQNYDSVIAALDVFSKVGYGLLLPV